MIDSDQSESTTVSSKRQTVLSGHTGAHGFSFSLVFGHQRLNLKGPLVGASVVTNGVQVCASGLIHCDVTAALCCHIVVAR